MTPLVLPVLLLSLAASPDDRALKSPDVPAALRKRIDRALDKGVRRLSAAQRQNGSWRFASDRASWTRGGLTSLCGLAILHGGLKPRNDRILRARKFVDRWMRKGFSRSGHRVKESNVYSLGLGLAFLLEAGMPPDDPLLRRITASLAGGVLDSGHWGYAPGRPGMVDGVGGGNISTSLYAVLGLRAAHRHGIRMDGRGLRMHMDSLRRTRRDGGWGYAPAGNWTAAYVHPYFSGTTNGLASYLMAGEILGTWSTPEEALEDPVVRDAVRWIAENFTPDRGPEQGAMNEPLFREPCYGLYAAERAGCLLAIRKFGDVDWYLKGARHLVSTQRTSGAWEPPADVARMYGRYYDATVTTAFGVLFLARGTRAVSTPPHAVRGAKTGGGFDVLDLRAGPRLSAAAFADLAAAALAAYERLGPDARQPRRSRFALLGARVVGPLVSGLSSARVARRRVAIEVLEALFGEDFDYSPEAPSEDRRSPLRMWEHWRRTVGPRLVLRGDRLVVGD